MGLWTIDQLRARATGSSGSAWRWPPASGSTRSCRRSWAPSATAAAGGCRTCCSSPRSCASCATALIAFVDAGGVGLALFAIANFAYQAALIYYDATLRSWPSPETRGRCRASGWRSATGHVIIAGLLILLTGSRAEPLTFLMAAVLFMVFAIPIFLFVREPAVSDYRSGCATCSSSFGQLGDDDPRTRARCPGCSASSSGGSSTGRGQHGHRRDERRRRREAIGLSRGDVNIVLLVLTVVADRRELRLGPARRPASDRSGRCSSCSGRGRRPADRRVARARLVVPEPFLVAGAILGSRAGRRPGRGPGAHAPAVAAGPARRVLRPVRARRQGHRRSSARCSTGHRRPA